MAPIRKTSQAAGGVGKKVHRKQPQRNTRRELSDSWGLLHQQGLNPKAMDIPVQDHDDDHDDDTSPTIYSPTDVQETVEPLREMAERVGKEVETFAETLDDFFNELPNAASVTSAVEKLVLDFKEIADKTVNDLKQRHEQELRQCLKQEWSEEARISAASTALRPFSSTASNSLSEKGREQVTELRKWQQEAALWDLFRTMLDLHPFESEAEKKRAQREEDLVRLGQPHRYTSESDLWERFVIEDDLARERHQIKTWLERTALHQDNDLQGITEVLEAKAGRGKGLWTSGWMNTRERIKHEKRLRSWPMAVDSPLPQIRRTDNNELLTTTLDPDAPMRQQRTLEKPDSYFERAVWIACWEMLRRGLPWDHIRTWCQERKEGWRAVCMARATDGTDPTSSNAPWRHICRLASQSGCSTEYEAAVFGLLGGNVKAVEKVCRTVDDHLYAHYSAALTRQFDQYLLTVCPEKAAPPQWQRGLIDKSLHDPKQAGQAIGELINQLRNGAGTTDESAQPMKIIQSYLLADEVGSMIHTVGQAIADTAALQGAENTAIFYAGEPPVDGPEVEVALDAQTLRIATHMAIIHRTLKPDPLEGEELHEDENVLVAYIQALRAMGKRIIIPIYASKLQRERYIKVLGRILQDITEPREQSEILALLHEYDLDIVAILKEQLKGVMENSIGGEVLEKPLRILEHTEDTKMHPGQLIIVDFLSDEPSEDDEDVVRCLQWFGHMHGGWKVTFEALSMALKKCLLTGRFTCARMIVQSFPYDEVSMNKSYQTVGQSINLMNENAATPSDEEEAMQWELMKRQSRTYFELEQLVTAVESLSTWRTEEFKYVNKEPKPSSVPSSLKEARKAVSNDIEPILKGILQNPVDEQEAKDLKLIRIAYLPEIIIAYNTVLHAAGNLITRDCLLDSMELANVIAKDAHSCTIADPSELSGLAECFIQAGRMRELVESLAWTSKVMLVLKAEGKPWKARKDRQGRDLGIWEIGSETGRGGLGGEE